MERIGQMAKALLMGVFFVWVLSNSCRPVSAQTSGGPFAYVPNFNDHTVSVVDTATNTVTATIPLPEGFPGTARSPLGVAVHPNGRLVYIANVGNSLRGAGFVSVIDRATDTVVANITAAPGSEIGFCGMKGVAVNPAGTRLYMQHVPQCGGGFAPFQLVVVDTATNQVIAMVDAGVGDAWGIAVNPAGTRVYMANPGTDSVSVIDTVSNVLVAQIPVGRFPIDVAVNPAGTRAYAGNLFGNSVSVIDTATNSVIAEIPAQAGASTVAVNPASALLYVTNTFHNTVSVIDTATNTVIATVPVGTEPFGVAVNPAGTHAYVTNPGSNNVSVIDTASSAVVATVGVGNRPNALGLFIGPATTEVVAIDIKPGSDPNSINLSSAGNIPVAILSTAAFDAPARVDPDSLRLAGAAVNLIGKSARFQCSSQDVNTDGLLDLVCHFDTAQFMIEPGQSRAVVEGKTFDGLRIRGEDAVRIVQD